MKGGGAVYGVRFNRFSVWGFAFLVVPFSFCSFGILFVCCLELGTERRLFRAVLRLNGVGILRHVGYAVGFEIEVWVLGWVCAMGAYGFDIGSEVRLGVMLGF